MSSLILVNQISMNYERTLYDGQDIDINGHAGIGYMSIVNIFGEDKNKTNVPFGFNVITGNTNSHFDLNLDGIYSSNFLCPDVTFGYRFQSQNEPFIFRTFLGTTGIGISFGVRF